MDVVIFYASEITELVLYGTGITFCILLIIQLIRSYPFHIHLLLIIMNLLICTLTFSIFRLTMIFISKYMSPLSETLYNNLQLIRLAGLSAGCTNFLAIFIERFWATIHVSTYENKQYILFPIISVSSSWVIWCLLTYLLLKAILTETFIFGFDLAICLISLLGMLILMIFQRKMHMASRMRWSSSHTHNLSEQYQLKENLRCSLLLIPLILAYTLTLISILLSLILNSATVAVIPLEVANAMYNITAGALSIAVPLFIALIILISKLWFILLPARLKRDSKIFDTHASFDLHFESLNKIWEKTDPSTIKHAGEAIRAIQIHCDPS